MSVRTLAVVLFAGAAFFAADTALGANQLLKPNGEFPGGVGAANAGGGITVRAFQSAYTTPNAPAGLSDALTRQGFTYAQTGIFDGDFQLDQYGAWARNAPALNHYGMNIAAAVNNFGGAHEAIGYIPGTRGPARVDARWLQVIRTNTPLGWGQTWGVGLMNDPGFTWYIDNGWQAVAQGGRPADPFYGGDDDNSATGYAGIGRGILDRPSRDLTVGTRWEAWSFIAVRIPGTRDVRIYNGGVYWGFEIVPAPGSVALLGMAGLVASRRRRD
jgi:hypothetical protein